MKKIYMIGNTHFDPFWQWRWDEAPSFAARFCECYGDPERRD